MTKFNPLNKRPTNKFKNKLNVYCWSHTYYTHIHLSLINSSIELVAYSKLFPSFFPPPFTAPLFTASSESGVCMTSRIASMCGRTHASDFKLYNNNNYVRSLFTT